MQPDHVPKPFLRWLAALTGLVLLIIGVRFVAVPASATFTFGIGEVPPLGALAAIVGLRDIWLAALAIALAWLGEWRALSLWLGLAVLVCFGDAWIVMRNGGAAAAIAFHAISGVFCAGLAWACRAQAKGDT